MWRFQFKGKQYVGGSALEIVRAIELDADHYPHRGQPIRRFLLWSLERMCDRVPPRDLDLSDRLADDELALSYLCLRDEFGVGRLSVTDADGNRRSGRA